MSESLHIDGTSVEVRRSKRRRTVDLFVDRRGEYVINVPESLPDDEILKILESKREWMIRTRLRKEEKLHGEPAKEWVSGEGLYWLGRKYRLKVVKPGDSPTQAEPVVFAEGRFRIVAPHASDHRDVFRQWYQQQTKKVVGGRIARLARRVGVSAPDVIVRDLGYRWGSCGKGGKIYFHWRIAMLPSHVIDYLIIHELCHLLEPRHSREFFRKLEVVSPGYAEIETWLAENGDHFDL